MRRRNFGMTASSCRDTPDGSGVPTRVRLDRRPVRLVVRP